jgi:hypothetical protein
MPGCAARCRRCRQCRASVASAHVRSASRYYEANDLPKAMAHFGRAMEYGAGEPGQTETKETFSSLGAAYTNGGPFVYEVIEGSKKSIRIKVHRDVRLFGGLPMASILLTNIGGSESAVFENKPSDKIILRRVASEVISFVNGARCGLIRRFGHYIPTPATLNEECDKKVSFADVDFNDIPEWITLKTEDSRSRASRASEDKENTPIWSNGRKALGSLGSMVSKLSLSTTKPRTSKEDDFVTYTDGGFVYQVSNKGPDASIHVPEVGVSVFATRKELEAQCYLETRHAVETVNEYVKRAVVSLLRVVWGNKVNVMFGESCVGNIWESVYGDTDPKKPMQTAQSDGRKNPEVRKRAPLAPKLLAPKPLAPVSIARMR